MPVRERRQRARTTTLRRLLRPGRSPGCRGKSRRASPDDAGASLLWSDPPTATATEACRATDACRAARVSFDFFVQPFHSPMSDDVCHAIIDPSSRRQRRDLPTPGNQQPALFLVSLFAAAAIGDLRTAEPFRCCLRPQFLSAYCKPPRGRAKQTAASP